MAEHGGAGGTFACRVRVPPGTYRLLSFPSRPGPPPSQSQTQAARESLVTFAEPASPARLEKHWRSTRICDMHHHNRGDHHDEPGPADRIGPACEIRSAP